MIFNQKFECMPPGKLKALQLERLKAITAYIDKDCPFYQKRLAEAGLHAKDIKSLSDIQKFPLTLKDDLRNNYPYGMLSVPLSKIIETHVSSGTTGNPTVVGYTAEDIDLWSEVMARSLCLSGARPGDMIQIAYGYGLFTGGLGFHYGALKLGLSIIPCSSGLTPRQIKIMTDFKPRILACTPSYSLYMAEAAREAGIDPFKSSWQIGIFGAEPWSVNMRTEIEKVWNMTALDIYGLCEIIGPGVAMECPCKTGLHLFSDVFYPEIIDPDTGKEVPEGQPGMLVLTTLTKTGMPLLRYATRDIVSINREPCACGRTSPRISKIQGRTDDMLIVRGVNVFPSQIEQVLLNIEETQPHYQLIVDRKPNGMDELEVLVEVKEQFFSDELKKLEALEDTIKKQIEAVLGVGASVRLVEPKSIARSEGKAKRVIDKRNI
ncbi:MAG: phenylacetate--CoA ligase [Candidatus Omnitrophica bacterium]|nr:phenylacetate--CoA ligase [Candidatus Omnitrophota bacterium]